MRLFYSDYVQLRSEKSQRGEELESEVMDGEEEEQEEGKRLYLGPGPEWRTAAVPGGQPPPESARSSSSAPWAQHRMKEAAGGREGVKPAAPQRPRGFTRPRPRPEPHLSSTRNPSNPGTQSFIWIK